MTNNETFAKASETLRKGWLAYLGVYGAAFERLQPRLEEANEKTAGLVDMLITKGETVEATAQETIEDIRSRATETYGTGMDRVRKMIPNMPVVGNDNARVAELEEEIAALNKKVTSLTKKVATQSTKKPAARKARSTKKKAA
jgi:polyhydroxyalkanoate synthesis regulator phasin